MTAPKPLKVHPRVLEAMWGAAAEQGKDAALEPQHPMGAVLIVDGQQVAYAAKSAQAAS